MLCIFLITIHGNLQGLWAALHTDTDTLPADVLRHQLRVCLLFPKWAVYIVAAIQGDDEAVSVHPARLDATRMGYVQRQHQHRARITQHSLYHRNSLAARYARSFLPTMKAKATHACRVMPWSCLVGGLLITNVGSSDTSHACVMACQALGLLLNVQGMVHDA